MPVIVPSIEKHGDGPSQSELYQGSPKRSWRSTGWKPLSYPSSALFSHSPVHTHQHTHALDVELNPFFPLHKDVVSATIRELLILDGALDSNTLEVVSVGNEHNRNDSGRTGMTMAIPHNVSTPDVTASNDTQQDDTITNDNTNDTDTSHPKSKSKPKPRSNSRPIAKIVKSKQQQLKQQLHQKQKLKLKHKQKRKHKSKTKPVTVTVSPPTVSSSSSSTSSSYSSSSSSSSSLRKRKRGRKTASATPRPVVTTRILKEIIQNAQTSIETDTNTRTGTRTRTRTRTGTGMLGAQSETLPKQEQEQELSTLDGHYENDACMGYSADADADADDDNNNNNNDNGKKEEEQVSQTSTRAHFLSAETLTEILMQKMLRMHAGTGAGTSTNAGAAKVGEQVQVQVQVNVQMQNENNRIRKVSDVGLDASFGSPSLNASKVKDGHECNSLALSLAQHQQQQQQQQYTMPSTSQYSAHLAVTAVNLYGEMLDMESSIQRFLHEYSYDTNTNTNINTNTSTEAESSQQANSIILSIHNQLPPLLDLSIIVEAHLRQIALNMVRCLGKLMSDKALREFLGYKSPTARNERVLELISDFLFDVSHAMFAWDQTEKDMFGNKSTPHHYTSKQFDPHHDHTICKTLFDSRALRKIGGFEPTSLLSHALSIKRLGMRGESWEHHSKTAAGRKMFLHHRDDFARVRAGAKRRDKRVKKNLAVCYPIAVDEGQHQHANAIGSGNGNANANANGIGWNHKVGTSVRSRSSSLGSLESGGQGHYGGDLKISTVYLPDGNAHTQTQTHTYASVPSCISPVVPDLIPITITRKAGKSWGILLAREGSMCVVMRVPDVDTTDASDEHEHLASISVDTNDLLQRGDLIVSIRNERNEFVNTPTLNSSTAVSPDWFSDAVGMFKKSETLHLEVRRVTSTVKAH